MNTGCNETELGAEDLNSENDKERGTEKPLPEVRPERNKDSTIHTAHQFLLNTRIKVKILLGCVITQIGIILISHTRGVIGVKRTLNIVTSMDIPKGAGYVFSLNLVTY